MRIAATARRCVQQSAKARKRGVGIEQVQTVVGIAFHRQNMAVRGQELLENGHLKDTPEQIAFQFDQFAMQDARKNQHRRFHRGEDQPAGGHGLRQYTQHRHGARDDPGPARLAQDLPVSEIRRENRDSHRGIERGVRQAVHETI
jgi:hypothetical protein